MHLEVLVEDSSGKAALDNILPKLIQAPHTFIVHSYRGIGRIPTNLRTSGDPSKRILLEQLPKLIRGYGKTFAAYPDNYSAALVIVCDLDDRCRKEFRDELLELLQECDPRPMTKFCIAVEEMEAWFLADAEAIRASYQRVNETALAKYTPDSICGTWELLADIIHQGGSASLKSRPYYEIGAAKHSWASSISPHLDESNERSPSFAYFRRTIRNLAT